MRLPRFVHRLYAWALGYFWQPCPACGEYFGGHEARDTPADAIILWRDKASRLICPACYEASR